MKKGEYSIEKLSKPLRMDETSMAKKHLLLKAVPSVERANPASQRKLLGLATPLHRLLLRTPENLMWSLDFIEATPSHCLSI